jgi:hypothetical protein
VSASTDPATHRRAALEALARGRLPSGTWNKALPRLRFDRVAQRLVKGLQAALEEDVPRGCALVVTVTAPIRLPARTLAELAARLGRPFAGVFSRTVCGNRVRARMVRSRARGGPRVIVFVHNPQPSPRALIKFVESWLGH